MAGTSYTTLPSSSYLGLGSQGDLYNSVNYGNSSKCLFVF